jgi:hypothetical protein
VPLSSGESPQGKSTVQLCNNQQKATSEIKFDSTIIYKYYPLLSISFSFLFVLFFWSFGIIVIIYSNPSTYAVPSLFGTVYKVFRITFIIGL